MNPSNITQSEALEIRKKQVYLLYKPSLIAALASVLAACLLAYIQWQVISHKHILLWLTVMGLVIILRVWFYIAFTRLKPTAQAIPWWEKSYVVISVAAGLVWGSAGIVLFPEHNFEHQAATVVVLTGMAAGAVTTLSALRAPVLIFLTLCMSPITIRLLFEMNPTAFAFALLCFVFLLFFIKAGLDTYQTHLQNISLHIQSQSRENTLKKSEAFLQKTSEILEMIAKGYPAKDIYDAIILLYESRHQHIRCSILECHGTTLKHGSAPSLPKAYCDAIDGIKIGPDVGSCGASTYTGRRVLVEDIATDAKWESFREFALSFDLRSCWSEPVKSAQDNVLGSFAIYSAAPCLPSQVQLEDLAAAAQLTGIIMEREQRNALLHKLHSAFEYAQNAIMITDLEARIEYVNPAFENMTGYSAQESVGKFTTLLHSPKHSEAFYIKLYEHCKQGKPWNGEITIQRKNGTLLETERNISPILDNNGNIEFFVAIMHDLTETKMLEKQFQQAQKMEAIGTLVGGIAHDFNNILAGIIGNTFLIKRSLPDHPHALQKLERVEQLSARATHLIQQLLTFARKDAAQLEPLELNALVQSIFMLQRTSTPENIAMKLQIPSENLHIYGNSTLIHQILLNLINNARDALEDTPHPHITITLKPFYPTTTFVQQHAYFKPIPYAQISVTDNGHGISASHIENIFDPFFTTKDVGKGTGLGLSMVYGAVKSHQGYIELDSQEGKGSTFRIYIPQQTDTADTLPEPVKQHRTTSTGSGETILLVDDDVHIREIGQEVLEELGYHVLLANNGLDAIDVFKANQDNIALVVTDMVMPKLGGIEAVVEIRKLQADIKVIFTTGYDKSTTQTTIERGDTMLSKPYDIETFSQTVQQILSRGEC